MTKPKGTPHRVRTSVSRQIILDAAVKVLEEEGLAAATTLRVQAVSGVSRGRLLHHFPSREALLVAAVQHLAAARFSQLSESYRPELADNRLDYAIESLWSLYSGPLFWTAVELWNGARTSRALREALLPQERKLGVVIDDLSDQLFGEPMISRPKYREFRRILISSMRGVAMTYTFDQRPMSSDPHLSYWKSLGAELLLDPAERDQPRSPTGLAS